MNTTTRRHRIVHRTEMHYAGEVRVSHNELRMTPVSEPGQTTLEARIRVKPLTWSHVYKDHWGTSVMAIESQSPHQVLEIEASSIVERALVPAEAAHGLLGDMGAGWAAVEADHVRDRLSEYLELTRRTRPDEELAEMAKHARSEESPRAAAARISADVHAAMTYTKGATGVHATGAEAWEQRRGVCQDYAHITVGALRSIGIPARYVGGYTPFRGDGARGEHVAGETHAWIEAWDGGWHPFDPTNDNEVGLDHVVVGRGRDYDDVAPFRGMYAGPDLAEMKVGVTVTRLA
ncbi:transglutaminase domain-containing protein [Janibacter sp. GXQ6167]|uniref:transglutaminase family protein n=1 Tax=Janibacter sp. GXQ6167 TaxID=3240791 RepID=UPI003524EE2D